MCSVTFVFCVLYVIWINERTQESVGRWEVIYIWVKRETLPSFIIIIIAKDMEQETLHCLMIYLCSLEGRSGIQPTFGQICWSRSVRHSQEMRAGTGGGGRRIIRHAG